MTSARLLVGSVAAACAIGLGAVVVAHEPGSAGGGDGARTATRLAGAPAGQVGGRPASAGGVHSAVLLADFRSAGPATHAVRGDGHAGQGPSSRAHRPRAPGKASAVQAAPENHGQSPSGPGRGSGGPPGLAGGHGHGPSGAGQGRPGHGRKDHGRGPAAPPPHGSRTESSIQATPPPAPAPAAVPSGVAAGTQPHLTIGSATARPGSGSTSARRGAGGARPSTAPRARARGSGSSGVATLLPPFVAGLAPLGLLPMVSGLQVGGAPQIAVFLLLANALLAAAIVLTSRRGRRLTRRSLEGGAGVPAARGAEDHLEGWPSAR